jgi:hypothetical protein
MMYGSLKIRVKFLTHAVVTNVVVHLHAPRYLFLIYLTCVDVLVALNVVLFSWKSCPLSSWEPFPLVGTGVDLGFNATIAHKQNPNYQPFRQHLRRRLSLTRGRGTGGCKTQVSETLVGTQICDYNT